MDHDLAARVAHLDHQARFLTASTLAREVRAIRAVAEANGILPVVAVARALERAVARGETGIVVTAWIAMLGEAVGSGRTDADSGGVLLAAGATRLAG